MGPSILENTRMLADPSYNPQFDGRVDTSEAVRAPPHNIVGPSGHFVFHMRRVIPRQRRR